MQDSKTPMERGLSGKRRSVLSFFLTVMACWPVAATAQTVTLSPSSLSFGNVVVGTTSPAKNVSLINSGTAALSITSIVASGSFAETNTCGSTVPAGKKCVISVTFTPRATGAASGTVTITDNATNSPQTVTTTGAGVVAVSLSPATLSFGSHTVGTTTNAISATLTNNQTTTLTISTVTVSGDFAQTNTCGTTLAAKAKCTISVTFTPTIVGSRTGTLTVTDDAGNSPQTSSLTGTGSTAGLTSIAISPANPSVLVGAMQQFTATGTFSSGETYNLTQSVTWNSSKSTVATISNVVGTQGLAAALATGTATITATASKILGSTAMTVTVPVLASIAVTPAAPSIVLGTQQQFTATGTYSDGSTQNLTSSAAWSSSAPTVATIPSGGLATSVTAGTSTISATSGSIVGLTTLTVTPPTLVSIAVTPAAPSIALGTQQQFTATGTYSDGSTQNLTSTSAWSSSAVNVATVSSGGLASSVAIGTTTISAASGSVTGSTTLTVTSATLVSIAVTPAAPAITLGNTEQFSATGTYSDASTQDVTTSATWTSASTAVATISNTPGSQGLTTSVAVGTSEITAALGSVTSPSDTLTVNPVPATEAVTTYHYDNYRTGWNQNENVLNPTNVASSAFGLLQTVRLDSQVDAQPLVVPGVNITAGNYAGTHDVVYVVTENNTVYAIDAESGTVLLSPNFGAPVNYPTGCLNPSIGIHSTPVIDLSSDIMYVMVYTNQAAGPTYYLHALDLGSLTDTVTPELVAASHVLSDGSTFNFNATYQRQRPALLLANGNVYAGFGAFCENALSRGWLLGWQTGTLTPLAAAEVTDTQATDTDNFFASSIWMSGYGLAADDSGNVLFVTGNSDFSGTTYDGVTNIQESVVKEAPDLSSVLDLFTPSNWSSMDKGDRDFGSGGVMVLPDQAGALPHLAVAAGKDGRMFLMNEDSLGGYSAHSNNVLGVEQIGYCWCGQSYYVDPTDLAPRVVTSGGANVEVWELQTTPSIALTLESSGAITSGGQDPGFFTSISSAGTANPIIWALSRPVSSSQTAVTLYAFNPDSGGSALSLLFQGAAGSWPNLGNNANLVPVVANGEVFVASNQQLQIFGLNTAKAKRAKKK
jgi:hypothetical protein